MSLWEFLETRLNVQGRGVPILWWVYGLACQVSQKCQGAELWVLVLFLYSDKLCVFKTYN